MNRRRHETAHQLSVNSDRCRRYGTCSAEAPDLFQLTARGELIIGSEERFRPYHRPALSKQLLSGAVRAKDIALPVHTELDAIWRYGVRANYLEPEEHILHLPGDERIEYDGLVIATGMQARHLPGAPRHDPRVHVLRTLADAVGIQRVLAQSRGGIAVIGGGFIGCELASAARSPAAPAPTITIRSRRLTAPPTESPWSGSTGSPTAPTRAARARPPARSAAPRAR